MIDPMQEAMGFIFYNIDDQGSASTLQALHQSKRIVFQRIVARNQNINRYAGRPALSDSMV